ncbi:MAG: hypothetical protein A2131_02715 [Candidatus Sungbacteria bacterium GWC2_49_10]|uniref:Phosphoribosylformylglycinamidine cyclo-ligase n=1 Tax=Candidatus Sungbacteria bacterium GWC2_49_10 TaxID=1802263 RepID=A0A1G2K5G4_9BACT|nr:MAG: hypothetical protein A2131_02715 [Candidatus Sungbacteria bacterium GWC2_49_10]
MTSTYRADGVNVAEGDLFSAFAGEICRQSFRNSPFVKVHDLSRGHFRGPRGFTLKNLPKGYFLDTPSDGVGTKVIVIDANFSHRQAARDLVAMTCGDITRFGGMPLILVNVLDVRTLGKSTTDASEKELATNTQCRALIAGLGEVCEEQKLVAFRGETAELGVCVNSENPHATVKFNWAGFALGVYHPKMMITGTGLRPGQQVVALKEDGFRANGISSVRKALAIKFGPAWFINPLANVSIAEAATPSVLYDRMLCEANGWYQKKFHPRPFKMNLVVHVTGGAVKSKFAEDNLFPRGLSAHLDELWKPLGIMYQCKEWRGMNDEECYETWNCGQGALVVVNKEECDDFVDFAYRSGIQAKRCGEITKEKNPRVTIRSQFTGKEIIYWAKK